MRGWPEPGWMSVFWLHRLPKTPLRNWRDLVKGYSGNITTAPTRAARETTIDGSEFVRVKKPFIRFEGDWSFPSPTKVLERKEHTSFLTWRRPYVECLQALQGFRGGHTLTRRTLGPYRNFLSGCRSLPCYSRPPRDGCYLCCSRLLPGCSFLFLSHKFLFLCCSCLPPGCNRGLLTCCSSSLRAHYHPGQCSVPSG